MVDISEESFYNFAISNLKSKYLIESEFRSLLKHIIYIKRLLKKYKDNSKTININLLINHFVILYNEFEQNSLTAILFYQINELYYPQLKTILLLLNNINYDDVLILNNVKIEISNILIDKELENILKKII